MHCPICEKVITGRDCYQIQRGILIGQDFEGSNEIEYCHVSCWISKEKDQSVESLKDIIHSLQNRLEDIRSTAENY